MIEEVKVKDEDLSSVDNFFFNLQTVYAYIQQNEQLVSAINSTFASYIDREIKEIEGPTDSGRLSKLQKVKRIEDTLQQVINRLNSNS
jgi:hypothetical protein